MNHACCQNCRLRFTAAVGAYLTACPECGERPQQIASLEGTVGFRLFGSPDLPHDLPQAVAVTMPLPDRDAQARHRDRPLGAAF